MYLKEYQKQVVEELKSFFRTAQGRRKEFEEAPEKWRNKLNYVEETFTSLSKDYPDRCKNGLSKYYPRVTIKVPTGGGKTLLAVEAIRAYQKLFAERHTGLVVWVVPKEIIYTQTIKRLRDKAHPYRQLLDQVSGGRILIKEKGQKLSLQDIRENLVILFIMIQSVSRNKSKEALKVFKDSGGYEGFFPADHRYDLHAEWLKETPNLDAMPGETRQLITSLGNAIRVSKPLFIIDEIHKVFTENAKKTIDNLNPEVVLGLSATPKKDMNILTKVTGLQLKEEEMIKLDMHIYEPHGNAENDWKGMLRQLKDHRKKLEEKAIQYRQNTSEYIRPIALIQVERTGKEQRGKGFVHSEDVKAYLIQNQVNPEEIAIKSSEKNEIANTDLLSSDCPIRFIITKEALSEGWDCPFAYLLGIIPHANSNTSMTQLIGRILRQPRARKTGIPALDESYVYYTKGHSHELLEQVKAGFKHEGLGDLTHTVHTEGQQKESQTKTVKIKDEFKKYAYAFYLPVWLMVNSGKRRKFSYPVDIQAHLNFHEFKLSDTHIKRICESLSAEDTKQKTHRVELGSKSEVRSLIALKNKSHEHISIKAMQQYLTRQATEVIDNAFLARKMASEFIDTLLSELSEDTLSKHFDHIASLVVKELESFCRQKEESLFLCHLNERRLELAVSDDPKLGYSILEKHTITANNNSSYSKNVYEGVEVTEMNKLEREVANILEKKDKLLWWFRNKVGKGWYAIQGWQAHKFWPDFVAAKRKNDDTIEIIYILESKGEHIKDSPNSKYKKIVMNKITALNQKGEIKAHSMDLGLSKFNRSVAAHFVEQNKEQEQIGALMK